jgi:hypothetical protein
MTGTARWTTMAGTAALLLATLAACSSGATGSPSGAGAATAVPSAAPAVAAGGPASAAAVPQATDAGASAATGGSGGGATGMDRCSLFTTDEVAKVVGVAVQTVDVSTLDVPGCEWFMSGGLGVVDLQVLPASRYADESGKSGLKPLAGVGDQAFIGPSILSGTEAGALAGETYYYVRMAPPPSDSAVADFLKQVVTRAGG